MPLTFSVLFYLFPCLPSFYAALIRLFPAQPDKNSVRHIDMMPLAKIFKHTKRLLPAVFFVRCIGKTAGRISGRL